jgi:hypothetical protein
MSDPQRVKLDSTIEREVHRLIHSISEGVFDRIQLQARKENLPIDHDVLTHILRLVQISITEFELKNIDSFHAHIKRELDAYAGDENPTDSVAPKATFPKNKKTAEVHA